MKKVREALIKKVKEKKEVAIKIVKRTILFLLATACVFSLVIYTALHLAPYPYKDRALLDGITFSRQVFDKNDTLLRLTLSEDDKYRIYSTLNDISPKLVEAVIVYEDRFFYNHFGVNPVSLFRAAYETYLKKSRTIGASTITMQTARLVFDLKSNTFEGKLLQIWRALQMDFHHSKKEILETYLNLAPYGGNIEGVSAASRIYFKKSATNLTTSESLALAIVPQNPNARNPYKGHDFNRVRAVFEEKWKEFYPQYIMANKSLDVYSTKDIPFLAPHLSQKLLTDSNSAIVTSTLDLYIQKTVEETIQAFARRGKLYGINNASALLVHTPTMEVKAYVGSADFHNSEIEGENDALNIRRSPGSTLKPFIFALAMEQGLIHEGTILLDIPSSFGDYNPENFNQEYSGPLPAQLALKLSRNIPAINLAAELETPDLYDFLKSAQVEFKESREHYGLSLVLGGAELKATELASLYSMLLNQGLYEPLVFEKDKRTASPTPLLSKESSAITLTMLEDENILNTRSGKIPLRIKTGTSNGFRDAWAIGTLGEYILLVWIGNFNNQGNPHFIGNELAVPLFTDISLALAKNLKLTDILPKNIENSSVREIQICSESGDINTDLCPNKPQNSIYIIPGKTPIKDTGILKKILVDTRTELRICQKTIENKDFVEERIAEFWSNDMQKYFREVGIYKDAPPPFDITSLKDPLCQPINEDSFNPIIETPKENVVYHINSSTPSINLSASINYDSAWVYWFIDGKFLAQKEAHIPLEYVPQKEVFTVTAIDTYGRSTSRKVVVEIDNKILY